MTDNRVVAAAIRRDGVVFTGVRHGHIIKSMVDVGFLTDMKRPVTYEEQGFIDLKNRFLSRQQARWVAYKAGQVAAKTGELYSEDLW